jgi:hypothetical protein
MNVEIEYPANKEGLAKKTAMIVYTMEEISNSQRV